MERSSPLAAMQPPSLPFGHWGCRGEAQSIYSEYNGHSGQSVGRLDFNPSAFNFKDLSMAKPSTDYFSLKPPPIANSSSIAVLCEPLWNAQWPGYGSYPRLLGAQLIASRECHYTAVALLVTWTRFGHGPSLPPASLMSAEECFASSPQGERRPQSAHSPVPLPMGPPRFKQSLSGLAGTLRAAGSPIVGHVRKPSNPMHRPRKQFRRSLSMFEHPGDVMNKEKTSFAAAGLDSIMDIDDAPRLQLPHFNSDEESLPRITKDTMIDILDGKFSQCYDRSIIIDCRFEYEAKHLRQKDRACNAHQYPKLTYPEVYILDGGYSSFFRDHKYRCYPQNYVEMDDKAHANACERGLGRIKQQRAKLSRAQTFAFGQHGKHIDDSPTASGRQSTSLMSGMDIAVDDGILSRRMQSRRMVSF
ncbi:hypothetical protein P7C71_g4671, partial [Lecanoromycetidae sp. Uapishka_2]